MDEIRELNAIRIQYPFLETVLTYEWDIFLVSLMIQVLETTSIKIIPVRESLGEPRRANMDNPHVSKRQQHQVNQRLIMLVLGGIFLLWHSLG